MELVPKEPKFLCVVQISQNTFVHVTKCGLEGNIPSLFSGARTYCCTSGGSRSKFCIYSSSIYST